jgi:hypothetical protein
MTLGLVLLTHINRGKKPNVPIVKADRTPFQAQCLPDPAAYYTNEPGQCPIRVIESVQYLAYGLSTGHFLGPFGHVLGEISG